ncbi:hypothetical protein [Paenibacillus soyae]|uniref:Uncharacterized protein n=1 Tax=Paenibacillus soyae TaxID=2969249 RepID=A0A9X2SAB4_9BACL|nr:hypothetical protein [Paenibacillus soyae]MCR2803632.1 hypothetical protein [Paenibacillus soyae]
MSNIIEFKARAASNPPAADQAADKGALWEKGFALYATSLGLLQIAKESSVVRMGEGPYKGLNKGIQMMAEADYERMKQVVVDPERIERALRQT